MNLRKKVGRHAPVAGAVLAALLFVTCVTQHSDISVKRTVTSQDIQNEVITLDDGVYDFNASAGAIDFRKVMYRAPGSRVAASFVELFPNLSHMVEGGTASIRFSLNPNTDICPCCEHRPSCDIFIDGIDGCCCTEVYGAGQLCYDAPPSKNCKGPHSSECNRGGGPGCCL